MLVNNLIDILNWATSAIRQHNYIGAESVITDLIDRIKIGDLLQPQTTTPIQHLVEAKK